jgi:hypothetical protein
MMAGGACFLTGTVLVTLAIHMVMLVLGRIVLGIGVGFATQVGCSIAAVLSCVETPGATGSGGVSWRASWPLQCCRHTSDCSVCCGCTHAARCGVGCTQLAVNVSTLLVLTLSACRPPPSTCLRWLPSSCVVHSTSCSR